MRTVTKTLTISLPLQLYKALERVAIEDDRSKNYLVKKAIESHLKSIAPNEQIAVVKGAAAKFRPSSKSSKIHKKRS
ncbi:MAG: hypothetical protein FJX34_00095 [Alphaproteobacteria bacterium]|nr:hypothetical protein [Alphaproteobacteria bacterium]